MVPVTVEKSIVYIVDDDASVGKSMSRLLSLEGFDVHFFLSAKSFLDSVPPGGRGCVISDIYMPEVNGFKLQQKMQELGYELPIIFMSAHGKTEDRRYATEHGASGFLLKPFEDESLLELIRRAVPESQR